VCGRYSLATPDPSSLRERFPVGERVEVRRRFNVAPGDAVLAVTADRGGAPRGVLSPTGPAIPARWA
jgi:putative SOS response-associated peptidase YedK